MFCPRCGAEYRDGFTECSHCRMALIPAVAPESADSQPEPVDVFESSDPFASGLARGLLEEAGVPFCMEGDETTARLGLGGIMFPSCRFLVSKDEEEEARELLEQLQAPLEEESGS